MKILVVKIRSILLLPQFEVIVGCHERVLILAIKFLNQLWVEISSLLNKLFKHLRVVVTFSVEVIEELWIFEHFLYQFSISSSVFFKERRYCFEVDIVLLWRELEHLL
mgnify:FL=1